MFPIPPIRIVALIAFGPLLLSGCGRESPGDKSVTVARDTAATVVRDTPAFEERAADASPRAAVDRAEIEKVTGRSFSGGTLRSSRVDGDRLILAIADAPSDAAYLATGDKINKLLAIEPVRIMRDLPAINRIDMTIKSGEKAYSLDVSRAELESHYGIRIGELTSDNWSERFIARHDTEGSREAFVEKFVKVR